MICIGARSDEKTHERSGTSQSVFSCSPYTSNQGGGVGLYNGKLPKKFLSFYKGLSVSPIKQTASISK